MIPEEGFGRGDIAQSEQYLLHLIGQNTAQEHIEIPGPEKHPAAESEEEKKTRTLDEAITTARIGTESAVSEVYPEERVVAATEDCSREVTARTKEPSVGDQSDLMLTLGRPIATVEPSAANSQRPISNGGSNKHSLIVDYIVPHKIKTYEKMARTQNVSPFSRSRFSEPDGARPKIPRPSVPVVTKKPFTTGRSKPLPNESRNKAGIATSVTAPGKGKKPAKLSPQTRLSARRDCKLAKRVASKVEKKPGMKRTQEVAPDFTTPHFGLTGPTHSSNGAAAAAGDQKSAQA